MDDLMIMSDVLEKEADAIHKLSLDLNDTHKKIVEMCSDCQGKVVLCGMGKSGHVARKISATLASLGTPSLYLHPGEAAHGDLGMVESKDLVMMISKSGETEEIIQLITSLKAIGCKLVGVFCREGSRLQQYCDETVILPVEEEACIHNLAPTTSTTLTMAFGDALAVALAARKGFGKNDFALFHPRGSLGKQLLLTVDDLAYNDIKEISVKYDESIKNVLLCITNNRLGAAAVIEKDNKLAGLISDGDIRRALKKDESFFAKKASDIMKNKPLVAGTGTLAVEAFKLMSKKKVSVLPIVDEKEHLVGMVSFHDIVASGIGDDRK